MELSLTGLAYGGEAFGRDDDGRMVFVPFALPNERVRVRITQERKRWARAELLEVLTPSSERIEPRCLHYAICGGCHYQHLSYPDQLRIKQEIVLDQLGRIGGFEDPPIEPTYPSPLPWNYRNNLRFSFDPQGRLGFVASSGKQVIAIQECHLPEPVLLELKGHLDLGLIPGLHHVTIRAGVDDRQLVVLHGEHGADVELHLDLPASVVWLEEERFRVLAGEDSITMTALERPFRVSAGSFFQVNTSLTGALVEQALGYLEPVSGETVFDLYAGVGLFSAFLAQAGARVVAVEESNWATNDFETNLHEFDRVDLYHSNVEEGLGAIPQRPSAVLLDPPRAGLSLQVLDSLIALAPSRLVYVSCDPATLARDGKRLARGGYSLKSLKPVDLFPQTFHIETVSLWTR